MKLFPSYSLVKQSIQKEKKKNTKRSCLILNNYILYRVWLKVIIACSDVSTLISWKVHWQQHSKLKHCWKCRDLGLLFSVTYSTSLTGSENHLASFRFQNTFLLNVWNRNGDRWFSDPVGEVLNLCNCQNPLLFFLSDLNFRVFPLRF